MKGKVPLWCLVSITFGVTGGLWLLLREPSPSPPDFTGQGFTSLRVELSGQGREAISAFNNDPGLVAGLTKVLVSGRSVLLCRCAPLGSVEFHRPDGKMEKVLIMPAHEDNAVEFRVLGQGRFQVNREKFLRVIEPLGIPAKRWYTHSPDEETRAKD